jgi:hypothetical protein
MSSGMGSGITSFKIWQFFWLEATISVRFPNIERKLLICCLKMDNETWKTVFFGITFNFEGNYFYYFSKNATTLFGQ